MPSSTETYLCDRFMAREQGSYLGVEDKEAWVSHSTQPPLPSLPPVHPTYTTHKQQAAPTSCGGSTIQFLTYPMMIAFTPLLSCLCSTATSTPSWRSPRGLTHKGRAKGREGRQREGGGALFHHRVMSSSGPGRCFLIFSSCSDKWLIVSLDKGTVFPVMGIRGRRKSPRHRVRLSQQIMGDFSWMQKARLLSVVFKRAKPHTCLQATLRGSAKA